MSNEHLKRFWECFPNPPNQQAVGNPPQKNLKRLNELCKTDLQWPVSYPQILIDREQLHKLCRDTEVDVLVAYAAVMAWGGRRHDFRNYRLSLEGQSPNRLKTILERLRTSNKSRKEDFKDMQQAARDIKGLGISFYTKLLFFFRPSRDAYILDQFTAKSVQLLATDCQVRLNSSGYPHKNTDTESYEYFCSFLETFAAKHRSPPEWKAEQVEQAMYDVRGGKWRNYLRSIYKTKGAKQMKNSVRSASGQANTLQDIVATAHEKAYERGQIKLPCKSLRAGGYQNRLHCVTQDGITWQYRFNRNTTIAEVFIDAKNIHKYDHLCKTLGITDGNFGDGISGNGGNEGRTRAIHVMVDGGTETKGSWDIIANEAIVRMASLHKRLAGFI